MKNIFFILLFLSTLQANNKAHIFASNEECKSCHTQIYDEFSNSMHMNSTPQKDPIHNAIWERHPANKKMKHYACGKCHTPAANNLNNMLQKGKQALPSLKNETHQDGISCAYCHRIEKIQLHKKHNTNIINKKEKSYYGTRQKHENSPYHEIVTKNNELMQNGNVCIGCHSHKMNKHQLNVCSTNIENEMNGENCVSCHMPKIKGSVSNLHKTQTHTFHGFAGSHYNSDMLSKYVDLSLSKEDKYFSISIKNHTSHALLLHPLRTAVLKVTVTRASEIIKMKNEIFVRVIGDKGKPAMPWKATTTLRDTMIQANEKRVVNYSFKLIKGDKVNVLLGWYLVNPKVVKQLQLDTNKVATKFIEFKKKSFNF